MEITYATSSSSDLTAAATDNYSVVAMPNRPVKVIPLQHPTSSSSFSTAPSASIPPLLSKWRSKFLRLSCIDWLDLLLPCSRWIRTYRWREYLQIDLMAGITVGVMLVPQSMSYARLAGLHPIYGLYSGLVPVFVYAIFGSSRQLAIGPVALVSLLVSNVLGSIVDSTDELYTELAILLALLVGILECIMGLLRLGWLIRFISHSVISGFTTASAIVIALSQAKYFLGYSIVRSSKIVPLIKSVIAGASKFSWPPFVMGSIILAILLVMKHLGKSRKHLRFLRATGPLTAVVLGTTFVKIFHPSSISVVGEIPQGLPKFSIPKNFGYAKSLIPTTLLITGVAILESVGIAKALAAKNGYELDANQELFGLGVANICGSFFSAYPTTGSFSRSAVNHESGAKTGLSGIVMGIIMGCALLFMTPLFTEIPQCALAAIVISAVMGLVDYGEAMFLWHVDKKDFLLWTITFIMTLFLGIEIGVLVGVGVSLAFVIHESANPHIAVTYIDSSAVQALKDLHQEYKLRDIQIAIANPNRDVLLTLSRSDLVQLIGKEWCFVRVHDAVQVCLQHVENLKETTPKIADLSQQKKPSFFQRLWKRQSEDEPGPELESGGQDPRMLEATEGTVVQTPDMQSSFFQRLWEQRGGETNPQSEPLLSRKS
ncbi:PREDICTED: sulfate transporter 4.1, chloroplastic-like isoform X2 [Nelumbo nucifera]|uniref:Sulfate transporter 4.1, chloroplastic-like isoform X2 n=1 Tax=Nelumbo nucifera TaxID=4432 RepID=A0A1U7ZNI0_NELNU|nr:PREDICTED: sulfate transporter 4.1, chloroplastic-like isoform X2 [Nelumbo nucifera]